MTGKLGRLTMLLAGAAVSLAMSGGAMSANAIVDLDGALPLGTVVVDNELGKAYFSLGNGRAISYALAGEAEGPGNGLQNAVMRNDGSPEPEMLPRHNLRWRR
jgi:hypothetical protein